MATEDNRDEEHTADTAAADGTAAADDTRSERTDDAGDGDSQDPADTTRLAGPLARDVAVALGALSLWAAADTWYAVTGLWLALTVAMADALVVGLLLAALFHEWGHYLGARLSGANVCVRPPRGLTLLRFDFDYDANDHRQFHWMTYGGHALHWLIFLLLVIALPLDSLSRITLVSAVFGFIAFATFIEVPIVRDTLSGADPATRLSALTRDDFRRAFAVGGLAGLFALTALA